MSQRHLTKIHNPPNSIKSKKSLIPAPDSTSHKLDRESILIILLLTVVTFLVYNGVLKSDFAYYDDEFYITANEHVRSGLTWEGIKWAFTSVGYSDNWHPLTWLTHMIDVQFFGLNPGGHHFTNLMLHILATLLLFGFLHYSTGELKLSALVSAFFAWHPMHVESVAWVAERKDVLSAVLGFASLWAYAWYARAPSLKKYFAVILLFALGLLAKPMLVALPFLLLVLDLWPLARTVSSKRNYVLLIAEKLPLLALAVVSAIITIIAQQGALRGFTAYSLPMRLSNSVISYAVYIGQLFWPGNLAVLYPFTRPHHLSVFFCGILLICISVFVILIGKRKMFLLAGWLWYLGTLVPVIGIMQVGSQAHADRYTYIPYVGLFLMIVWGMNEVLLKTPHKILIFAKTALAFVCLAMLLKTWNQVGYWKDGVTLLTHTIAVTRNNEIAHYNLGNLMQQSGRSEEAIEQYIKSLSINPNKLNALGNLAGVYFQTQQYEKAKNIIQKALHLAKAAGDTQQIKDIQGNIELLNRAMNPDSGIMNRK
jgi:protein O-mannosyl-transferase